jgi:2-oxoglutarate dehydrogenase E2 component (dihydrolipoamide succinyltransferase)
MSIEITVPQLGESIVEATVGRWQKNEGERVTTGESLVELETDKVNVEVTAPGDGVLTRVLKHEGDTVNVGELLATVDSAAEQPTSQVSTAASNGSSTSGSPSPRGGLVRETSGSERGGQGEGAAPTLSPEAGGEPEPEARDASGPPSLVGEGDRGRGQATPVARRIAAERHIDLQAISGTGAGGKVTQDDVEAYLSDRASAPTTATTSPTATASGSPPASGEGLGERAVATTPPLFVETRREERVRMSRRRQTIAKRLVEAQHTAAMLTTFNEIDMSAVMEVRKRRRDAFKERYNVSLGYMSFFTRAVVGALKAFPRLNAEIQGNEMVLKRYYDIGIAVGVEEGLVVPVLRDADRMSFAEIEQQIAVFAEKARKNQLTLEEIRGGTFTISNGGVYGSLLSTPILNGPQVGILGMHKIQERPIAVNGAVVVHPMMYVALSYDHRIVDGSEAVRFLVRIKELLEDPEALLLEG